jgi:branched-chain amino acid transport system ATP-binding protein
VALLTVEGLTAAYGAIRALREVSLSVDQGEVVTLIGPNGAGKTTLLHTVAGLHRPSAGRVRFRGEDVTGKPPDELLRRGMALVPEHRRIFRDLTVRENLLVGGVTAKAAERRRRLDGVAGLFPALERRWTTPAGYLSGGEAQQLAIARTLMSDPELVLMDEPSLGLAPALVEVVMGLIARLRHDGRTVLVVEQNAHKALEVADRGYVLRSGEVVETDSAPALAARPDLFQSYLGT